MDEADRGALLAKLRKMIEKAGGEICYLDDDGFANGAQSKIQDSSVADKRWEADTSGLAIESLRAIVEGELINQIFARSAESANRTQGQCRISCYEKYSSIIRVASHLTPEKIREVARLDLIKKYSGFDEWSNSPYHDVKQAIRIAIAVEDPENIAIALNNYKQLRGGYQGDGDAFCKAIELANKDLEIKPVQKGKAVAVAGTEEKQLVTAKS